MNNYGVGLCLAAITSNVVVKCPICYEEFSIPRAEIYKLSHICDKCRVAVMRMRKEMESNDQ